MKKKIKFLIWLLSIHFFLLTSCRNCIQKSIFVCNIYIFRGPRLFKLASFTIIVFLVSSWITTFTIAMQYNYQARIEEPFALFDQLYDKPWMRVGPYLVGMITGWLLFKLDCKMKINKIVAITCWIGCIAIFISLVYGLGRDGLTVPLSAFYVSIFLLFCSSYLIVSCTHNYCSGF